MAEVNPELQSGTKTHSVIQPNQFINPERKHLTPKFCHKVEKHFSSISDRGIMIREEVKK